MVGGTCGRRLKIGNRWDKWSARHMAGDVIFSDQILFLEQRHCYLKFLGINEELLAWPTIALIELGNHSVFRCHWGTFVKTLVSGTASGGGNWRAKRNFCSTQSVNDSKSTRKISFARLPLVCLYFGVSCELDLCLVSLASAAVALLAILAVAVLQYCLQDSVLQCVSMAVILLLLLLEAFTDRWPILAHVHSFGHLVAI